MTRFILTIAALTCLSLSAEAQWYLFPNKQKKERPDTLKKTEMPAPPKPFGSPESDKNPEAVDSTVIEELDTDVYSYEKVDNMEVGLILPFNAGSTPNVNFFEMYCGVLLAVRDLGDQGLKINLNVYDANEDGTLSNPEIFSRNHILIGPVTPSHMEKCLASLPEGKFIVSPLDPKVSVLTDSSRVIQAPCPWTAQYDELARWIAEDMIGSSEKLIVIRDSDEKNEHGEYMISRLEKQNIRFECIAKVSRNSLPEGAHRYVIASDRDDFTAMNIRELSLSSKNCHPKLYTTSKVRNLPLDQAALYRLNTSMTSNYFIDYNNPKVREFLLAYRSLFNSEPGSFAFQGYDIAHFFIRMCEVYGKQWYKKLDNMGESGLQADFRFIAEERIGHNNHAVRRILYSEEDMLTTLQ